MKSIRFCWDVGLSIPGNRAYRSCNRYCQEECLICPIPGMSPSKAEADRISSAEVLEKAASFYRKCKKGDQMLSNDE
jgi:hypothetical protein